MILLQTLEIASIQVIALIMKSKSQGFQNAVSNGIKGNLTPVTPGNISHGKHRSKRSLRRVTGGKNNIRWKDSKKKKINYQA